MHRTSTSSPSELRSRLGLRGLLPLLVVMATACGVPADSAGDLDRPRVVTTIGMITDLAEQIGGERLQIVGLMGPGVDPHLYRASPRDLRALSSADLVLYHGLFLEASMAQVLEEMATRSPTVAVTRAVPRERLLSPSEFEGAWDPHIWSDVGLWRIVAAEIRDAFIALDPEGEDSFQVRHAALDSALEELDEWIRDAVTALPEDRRILVTAHDAFHYFGRAYGFEVRALQGISTVAEAGARDVQELVAFLLSRGVPALFVESSVPERMLSAVRQGVLAGGGSLEIGGMLYSDALGTSGTPEGTYIGMMEHNVRTILSALSAEGGADR